MKIEEIKQLIQSKVKEHEKEVHETANAIEALQREMAQKLKPEQITKIAVLKDKIIFHKAAAAALADLKGELND